MHDSVGLDEARARIMAEAEELRGRLVDDAAQLDDIHRLYAEYVKLGVPFPVDLEEHSLRLILKFVRPDDMAAASRLATVLQGQGKDIPDDLLSMPFRQMTVAPEEHAATARSAPRHDENTLPIHERLVFVFGLPKSASRLMVRVLAAMHPMPRFRKNAVLPYSTGDIGMDATTDLRIDALRYFDDGGIIHSHAPVSYATRKALSDLGLSHVITVRHPADHIAALYCHIRRQIRPVARLESHMKPGADHVPDVRDYVDLYGRNRKRSGLFFHPIIFPIDQAFFDDSVSVDTAISHLLIAGYLYHALAWIVSWQLMRVQNISAIVRYEDFIARPAEALAGLGNAIFPDGGDRSVARGLDALSGGYEPEGGPESYPRGTTGERGVWRNYFSNENAEAYNRICEAFVSGHPYGELIEDLYDDLILTDKR